LVKGSILTYQNAAFRPALASESLSQCLNEVLVFLLTSFTFNHKFVILVVDENAAPYARDKSMGVTYDEMKESKDCDDYRPDFVPGALVEREIEGMWFLAEIIHSHRRGTEFTLRYVDDDNEEEGVSIDEMRISRKVESLVGSPKAERKSVLPKPLLGLIEDDAATRYTHEAKVTIHQDSESGTVCFFFILKLMTWYCVLSACL
jgi:hypothetical protein